MAKRSGNIALHMGHGDAHHLGDFDEGHAINLMQLEEFAPLSRQRGKGCAVCGRIDWTPARAGWSWVDRVPRGCVERFDLPGRAPAAPQESK